MKLSSWEKNKKVNAGSSSGPREKERHDDDDEGEGEGQQEEENEREGDGGRPQGRETPWASGNLRHTLLPLNVWPADDQWPDLWYALLEDGKERNMILAIT